LVNAYRYPIIFIFQANERKSQKRSKTPSKTKTKLKSRSADKSPALPTKRLKSKSRSAEKKQNKEKPDRRKDDSSPNKPLARRVSTGPTRLPRRTSTPVFNASPSKKVKTPKKAERK
jgi:hypothetical protein